METTTLPHMLKTVMLAHGMQVPGPHSFHKTEKLELKEGSLTLKTP